MSGFWKRLSGSKKKQQPQPTTQPSGSAPGGDHSVPQSKPVSIGVRVNSPFAEKTHHTISGSKRSSANSRDESAAVLGEGPAAAAQKILDALQAKQQGLKAFEKVSFAMAGQPSAELIQHYAACSGGRSLPVDLQTTFKTNPGPKAGAYLVDALSNDGIPSLSARLWVVFGQVDRSGEVSRTLALIPKLGDKIGNAGDEDRVVELFEGATPQERKTAWADASINKKIKGLSGKIHRRLELMMTVETRTEDLEQAAPGSVDETVAKAALSKARDMQLAEMVRQRLKDIPGTGKVTLVVGGIDKLATKAGLSKGSEQKWQYMGFDAKKFYDDLVDWKSTASSDDLAEIKKPTSHFNAAIRLIPHNVLMGMTKSERRFIANLSGDTTSDGASKTQVKAVEESLKRQKDFVDRGEGTGAYVFSLLTTKIGTRKWRDLATEIKILSAEQRKEMLDRYDVDPSRAMTKLEADLKAAGMDKETRAEILARFNTDFGNIGDNYAALWKMVERGKMTKLKTIGGHLKPTKLKKIGDAFTDKAIGSKAMKLMYELEDNEFALVRQDTELLQALRNVSDDKTWAKILDLLGMNDIDDQLTVTSTRELVHQARLAGEANPKRFAIQLNQAIGEEIVLSGVSAGRDKAQLYTIADRAMNAAKLRAREDGSDPVTFLNACLDELAQMDRGTERVDYLVKRVPQVYAVFKHNTPIPVKDRLKRAKHEGFGIGGLRKIDRQKVQWSFATLSGKQLLDEWSNVDDFLALQQQVTATEAEVGQATNILNSVAGDPASKDRARAEELLATKTALLADLYDRANTFTIGIKNERRAELKKYGVNAGDRVQFEAMVSDRIADAMDESHEVQAFLDDIGLPYDDFMKAKMKGVDALEMQRYLDSTRQWHAFSTKTSELSEATRVVKGRAVGTEQQLAKARSSKLSGDQIKDIRSQGAESTEQAISDRNVVEARFKDMQATFRQRAMVLFKLIVTAIITGVVAAATYGAGTPLAIAIHCALELGFNALNVMYQYYVLGERNKTKLAATFALGVLESALRILTTNVAGALNLSLLHPDNIPGTGLDWVAPNLLKAMGKVVQGTVMFAPKHILDQAFHNKDLEKVVKEGEADMVEEALKTLGKETSGFMRKMLLAGVKQGLMPQLESATSPGGAPPPKSGPPQRSLGQAFTDRMQGGGNQQEAEDQWAKYEKQKHKAAKRDAKKMLISGPVDKDTKKAEQSAHKDHLKEMREKEPKGAEYTLIKGMILTDGLQPKFRAARGDALLRLLAANGVGAFLLRGLSDDEKGSIEDQWHMTPGQLDRELKLAPDVEAAYAPLLALVQGGSIDQQALEAASTAGTVDAGAVLRAPGLHVDHLAVGIGIAPPTLRRQLQRAAFKGGLAQQRTKPLPTPPRQKRTPPQKPLPAPPRPARKPPQKPLPKLPNQVTT